MTVGQGTMLPRNSDNNWNRRDNNRHENTVNDNNRPSQSHFVKRLSRNGHGNSDNGNGEECHSYGNSGQAQRYFVKQVALPQTRIIIEVSMVIMETETMEIGMVAIGGQIMEVIASVIRYVRYLYKTM